MSHSFELLIHKKLLHSYLCVTVYYIYSYFDFNVNIACQVPADEDLKDLFICSKKTKPGS